MNVRPVDLRTGGWLGVLVAGLSFACHFPADAAQLKQARVTHVVKDVKLLPGQARRGRPV
ncbi:MAG: hypothetical protein M3372_03870 [Verrucomicrobiota bacterium]|nr:hypothetical protein [Verrucomicrobiota bacterium]